MIELRYCNNCGVVLVKRENVTCCPICRTDAALVELRSRQHVNGENVFFDEDDEVRGTVFDEKKLTERRAKRFS